MDLVLTDQKMQQYVYELFNSSNTPKHQSFTPLSGKEDRCNSTVPTTPTFGQAVVRFMCSVLAQPGNENRGVLAWHSTGSGKTCAAAAAADAFVDSGRDMYFVTSSALNEVSEKKLLLCGKSMFGRDTLPIKFVTYAILSHRVKNTLEKNGKETISLDAFLIMDEIHLLFNPLPGQRADHVYLAKYLLRGHTFKILAMTATPGNDVAHLQAILDIVRDPRNPKIAYSQGNKEQFKQSIRGLVSYVDNSYDESVFPKFTEEVNVKVPMTQKQYDKYKEKENLEDHKDYAALINKNLYYSTTRKYSNTLHDVADVATLEEFSAKLPWLLDSFQKRKREKHYVYSAFFTRHGFGGHGINAIANVLEHSGFTRFRNEDIRDNMNEVSDKERFIVLSSKELSEDKQKMTRMLDFVNHPANCYGQKVRIILATQNYYEGIDLKSVRNIHLFEPLVEYQVRKQAIGRVARHCSHGQLKKEFGEWTVTVHNYFSMSPPKRKDATFVDIEQLTRMIQIASPYEKRGLEEKLAEAVKANYSEGELIDSKIYKEAEMRYTEMKDVLDCLVSASIDCILTSSSHGQRCLEDYNTK